MNWQKLVRLTAVTFASVSMMLGQMIVPAVAAPNERALYLYYTHTKETARIVFKRNGQYDSKGLATLNTFLRDWRRNEPAKMDPRLFDLVWEVYNEVGASQPINVVSAYRSPKTNAMLRATSSGVAENSQHTKGHAMDFFIPGVNLTKLREVAMRKQVGGVGFYPTSGSPFVHLDTGSVRAWPRMTRAQLQKVFPDGRTMHVPNDGKPLSQAGYRMAQAEWAKCHSVPCGNGSSGTAVARNSGPSLIDRIFGGGNDKAAPAARQSAPVQVAANAPTERRVQSVAVDAPTPAMRPASLAVAPGAVVIEEAIQTAEAAIPVIPFGTSGSAPLDEAQAPTPARKSQRLMVATAETGRNSGGPQTAVLAIAALEAPVPAPRLQMTNPPEQVSLTAYAPAQDQRAMESLIARSSTEVLPPLPAAKPRTITGLAGMRTASLGGTLGNAGAARNEALNGMMEQTFGAVHGQTIDVPAARALQLLMSRRPQSAIATREIELTAPDLEHVADTFVAPVAMSSTHFAVIFPHDEADFSSSTQLGNATPMLGMTAGTTPELSHTSFTQVRQ